MNILLLSFYYPPDLSACSFRTQALVKAMLPRLAGDARIDVITTLPNRYASFSAAAPEIEHEQQLSVYRVALPSHQSGMVDQARAFITYARAVNRLVKGQQYDLVVATSSRLMTATLGACIARRQSATLYLDIRDIFVENLRYILPKGARRLGSTAFSPIERWTIGQADKINLVSPGFAGYFEERYPSRRFSWFTNGVDELFAFSSGMGTGCDVSGGDVPERDLPEGNVSGRDVSGCESRLRVVYAGNMGTGQGLDRILPELAKHTANRLDFVVIGDGGGKDALQEALQTERVSNVQLLDPLSRDKLMDEYRSADILFLHLNDMPAFLRVLPSKLFEYAATGKPIWAGLAGHAADFVGKEINNAVVFPPCDALAALQALEQLDLNVCRRDDFVERYRRTRLMEDMADDILETRHAT
ncbi:Glycosyltransferase involved in cell wall bisynthesis [Halomonas cupida]|uniref:Glycosyltransferase involved in cell wall bisynthesis n=1 Tax=Halomonas cupida TaxID=44933 RepID=A0A1M7LV85_9GAMM|nr:Glycosyltransferase involved in cell wall bisynthesis [Halomonas cupida]